MTPGQCSGCRAARSRGLLCDSQDDPTIPPDGAVKASVSPSLAGGMRKRKSAGPGTRTPALGAGRSAAGRRVFTWLNTAGELRSERTRVCSPRKGRCVCVRHRGEHAAVRPAPRGCPTGIRGRGPVAQSSPHQACQGALCGSVSNSRAAMCETVNGLCPSLRKGPCRVNPARNPDGRREPLA